MSSNAIPFASAVTLDQDQMWLNSRRWDLLFLLGSAILVPLPLTLVFMGVPQQAIDLLITLLVGGPHLYATYTYTFMEKRFLQRHPYFALSAVWVPLLVVYLAITNLTVLLTFFFFWASVHVLHQIAFLTDCYRQRGPNPHSLGARLIDYSIIFSSLYPIATYKLVNDQFKIAGHTLQIPSFVKADWVVYAVWAWFAVSLALFVGKTMLEVRNGSYSLPKLVLMSMTIVISFFLTSFNNLDMAFQGFNTWHSFQYLALVWFMNTLRKQRGEISSPFFNNLAGPDRFWGYYFFNMGIVFVAAIILLVLFKTLSLSWDQCFYSVMLSSLLTHYYIDHLVFTKPETFAY